MKYFSLNKQSPSVSFSEAAILGQAPDKGLYFPERIPVHEKSFFKDIKNIPGEEIAFRIMQPFAEDSIPEDVLFSIIKETISFPIPLVKVTDRIYSLELFHGPTMAFKDVGARFMSRCLAYFVKEKAKKLTVLVATSGDTGGAVADGFFDVPGIEVVILFPSGKVSGIQEKQLTTYGKNITALEVEGTFDDCQAMVKQAFADKELNSKLFLTSANSINVARWLPQQIYYFLAYRQWPFKDQPPVISVPSGNFGNICAGLLANASGLPVNHFIAACNVNDVVPRFLQTGKYEPQRAIATLSNAMDVGSPSNFVRVMEIFENHLPALKKRMTGYSINDNETKKGIQELAGDYNYIADPHGAVGYLSLKKYIEQHNDEKGIFLETAHPVKFFSNGEDSYIKDNFFNRKVEALMCKESKSLKIPNDYKQFKEYLAGN